MGTQEHARLAREVSRELARHGLLPRTGFWGPHGLGTEASASARQPQAGAPQASLSLRLFGPAVHGSGHAACSLRADEADHFEAECATRSEGPKTCEELVRAVGDVDQDEAVVSHSREHSGLRAHCARVRATVRKIGLV